MSGSLSADGVCYLGPEGTFSHILALKCFGRTVPLLPCPTLDAVVEGTLERAGWVGLLPVENSSGGTVYDTVDGLIRSAHGLSVVEEISLDVRIALLGHHAVPPEIIYSHFTQVKHHAAWLSSRFPDAELAPVESTALAARMAAGNPKAAALAAPGAARIYGLDVLDLSPKSEIPNVTHFFIVCRNARPSVPSGGGDHCRFRTALIAALPNVCGSLHAFLGPFAGASISLSRIVSRPVPGKPQTYVFFIEIEGAEGTASVDLALRGARARSESLTSLGSYPTGRHFES